MADTLTSFFFMSTPNNEKKIFGVCVCVCVSDVHVCPCVSDVHVCDRVHVSMCVLLGFEVRSLIWN